MAGGCSTCGTGGGGGSFVKLPAEPSCGILGGTGGGDCARSSSGDACVVSFCWPMTIALRVVFAVFSSRSYRDGGAGEVRTRNKDIANGPNLAQLSRELVDLCLQGHDLDSVVSVGDDARARRRPQSAVLAPSTRTWPHLLILCLELLHELGYLRAGIGLLARPPAWVLVPHRGARCGGGRCLRSKVCVVFFEVQIRQSVAASIRMRACEQPRLSKSKPRKVASRSPGRVENSKDELQRAKKTPPASAYLLIVATRYHCTFN